MNPLYDQRSKAGYERMQERMQKTKGRDVKELSSEVENKRRLEKEGRLEREEEHRKMLTEHAADLRNRVKTAGAAGRSHGAETTHHHFPSRVASDYSEGS
jgi:hypothetical protein